MVRVLRGVPRQFHKSRFITAIEEIEDATFDPHRQPNSLV
jgi:hypothetical protein